MSDTENTELEKRLATLEKDSARAPTAPQRRSLLLALVVVFVIGAGGALLYLLSQPEEEEVLPTATPDVFQSEGDGFGAIETLPTPEPEVVFVAPDPVEPNAKLLAQIAVKYTAAVAHLPAESLEDGLRARIFAPGTHAGHIRGIQRLAQERGAADGAVGLPAIAELVGVSLVTLRKIARDPTSGFPAKMVGGRWWASRRAVLAWVAQQSSGMTKAQRKGDQKVADMTEVGHAISDEMARLHVECGLDLETVLIGAQTRVASEMCVSLGRANTAQVLRKIADHVDEMNLPEPLVGQPRARSGHRAGR